MAQPNAGMDTIGMNLEDDVSSLRILFIFYVLSSDKRSLTYHLATSDL